MGDPTRMEWHHTYVTLLDYHIGGAGTKRVNVSLVRGGIFVRRGNPIGDIIYTWQVIHHKEEPHHFKEAFQAVWEYVVALSVSDRMLRPND